MRILTVAGVLTFASLVGGCQGSAPPAEEAGPLEGAWRITEVSFTSPDTNFTETNPQPSLYIFAERHYSIMNVPGNVAREQFSGGAPTIGAIDPTDTEKLAAYDSFIANSGTYEISGSLLNTRPMVAKNPNFMSGGSLSYTFEVDGGTLRLTLTPPWAPDTETVMTLTRLE